MATRTIMTKSSSSSSTGSSACSSSKNAWQRERIRIGLRSVEASSFPGPADALTYLRVFPFEDLGVLSIEEKPRKLQHRHVLVILRTIPCALYLLHDQRLVIRVQREKNLRQLHPRTGVDSLHLAIVNEAELVLAPVVHQEHVPRMRVSIEAAFLLWLVRCSSCSKTTPQRLTINQNLMGTSSRGSSTGRGATYGKRPTEKFQRRATRLSRKTLARTDAMIESVSFALGP
eukprot:scaffold1175_cov248-Pinguiococcus_pyrenoidosus.AAC.10